MEASAELLLLCRLIFRVSPVFAVLKYTLVSLNILGLTIPCSPSGPASPGAPLGPGGPAGQLLSAWQLQFCPPGGEDGGTPGDPPWTGGLEM
jgi:hypothetical protein